MAHGNMVTFHEQLQLWCRGASGEAGLHVERFEKWSAQDFLSVSLMLSQVEAVDE